MTREQLEHVLRAAGAVINQDRLVVVGSQAILGQFPMAPPETLQSMEADLIPIDDPDKWNLIDGVLGEGSPFHETFGYYADGVEESTPVLPRGWKERLVAVSNENTRGVTGLCLEIHDLMISKYCAGREKDLVFTRAVVRHKLCDEAMLWARLQNTTVTPEIRALVEARIRGDFMTLRG